MKSKSFERTVYLCRAALIAAAYVVLTLLMRVLGLDSYVIQLRLSEMLCILPIFTSAAIPGLTIGCFLANLLSRAVILDVIVGPVATLIGAVGTYLLKKYKWLAPLPPVLSNTVIIPFVLSYGYGMTEAIPFMMMTVGIGEVLSIYGAGMVFYFAIHKHSKRLFE